MRKKITPLFRLLPILILGFTPIIWFLRKPGAIINGLDTNFPLDPLLWFERRFYVWNDVVNAGTDFSSSTSGLFFHLIQVFFYSLGFNLQLTQVLSLIFWFMTIVLAAYIFARIVISKKLTSQLIFVVIYSFNIYLFNTWENVKVSNLSLVVALPLFIALLHKFKAGNMSRLSLFAFSALAAIFASGTGINPAYFIALVVGILIYVFVVGLVSRNLTNIKTLYSGLFIALSALLLVNIFWVLPLLNFLFFSNRITSLEDIGFTNWLDGLSENTSIVNVIRLQGAWDWYTLDIAGQPVYIPYASNYFYNPLFVFFSFIVPVLATASFLFQVRGKKEIYNFFGVLLIIGVVLGVGSHSPTGNFYKFLSNHLPFFSFFRSPWYIFTPYLILALAGLVACLFNFLQNLNKEKIISSFLLAGAAIFIFGYLVYSYPLITGKIFRPSKPDSFYSYFPDYLWQVRKNLREQSSQNRLISYPDDQLEEFKWGYKGTESILGLFSNQAYISPSFNFENHALGLLLQKFYTYIKKREYDSALKILPYFGADAILNKNDAKSISQKINEDDQVLNKLMNKNVVGEWTFFQLKDNKTISKIYTPKRNYINMSTESTFADLSTLLEDKPLVVWAKDSKVGEMKSLYNGSLFFTEGGNQSEYTTPTSNIQKYVVTLPKASQYNLILEKKGMQVNKSDLNSNIRISIDNALTFDSGSLKETEQFFVYGPVNLKEGNHDIEVRYPIPLNLISIENMADYSTGVDLRTEELPADRKKTLLAYNDETKEKKIKINISNFSPFVRYVLSFSYKYFYGRVPIVDVLQSGPGSPYASFPDYTGSSFDWEFKTLTINPVPLDSKLEVFITMPPNSPKVRSKTFIENLSLNRIYDNKLYLIENSGEKSINQDDLKIAYSKKSPVEYEVNISGVNNSYYLVFLESYNKNWQLSSADIKSKPIHFTANGYANGWFIPGGKTIQKLKIYYFPQKYFDLGLAIAGLTISGSLVYFFWKKFNKKIHVQ